VIGVMKVRTILPTSPSSLPSPTSPYFFSLSTNRDNSESFFGIL
jgi:hypothetical protein